MPEFALQIGYSAERDSYALIVDGSPRCEVKRECWEDFLDWLKNRWGKENFGCFEVFYWPRSNERVLLAFADMEHGLWVLWAGAARWNEMVAALREGAKLIDVPAARELWERQTQFAVSLLPPQPLVMGLGFGRN